MKVLLADAGLECVDVEGIAWSPTRGLHLSDDVRLNYLVDRGPRLTLAQLRLGASKPTPRA